MTKQKLIELLKAYDIITYKETIEDEDYYHFNNIAFRNATENNDLNLLFMADLDSRDNMFYYLQKNHDSPAIIFDWQLVILDGTAEDIAEDILYLNDKALSYGKIEIKPNKL